MFQGSEAEKSCHKVYYVLSATFVRRLFSPAPTKEASNKPAENRNRLLKFNSDTIEHF